MNFTQFAGFPTTLTIPQFAVTKFVANHHDAMMSNGIVSSVPDEPPHTSRSAENVAKKECGESMSDYFVRFSGQPTFPSNLQMQNLYSFKPSPEVTAAPSPTEHKPLAQFPKKTKKKKRKAANINGLSSHEPRKRSTSLQPVVSSTMDGRTVFSCPQCHSIFNDQDTVNGHMTIHRMERPFVCEECGAALKRKEHLDRHRSSHMTDRPHLCHVCNKSFKRQEHLQRHSIIHRTDKAHHCIECGKGFNRKDHLNKHMHSHLSKRVKQDVSVTMSM